MVTLVTLLGDRCFVTDVTDGRCFVTARAGGDEHFCCSVSRNVMSSECDDDEDGLRKKDGVFLGLNITEISAKRQC